MKVEVREWKAVATWTWNLSDDDCSICRMPFDGCPPEAKYPGDDSPVVLGVCGHAFHLLCINKWLTEKREAGCPYCRRPWQFKTAEQ